MELWHAAWAALAGACVVARLGSRNYGDGGKGLAAIRSTAKINGSANDARNILESGLTAIGVKRLTKAPAPIGSRRNGIRGNGNLRPETLAQTRGRSAAETGERVWETARRSAKPRKSRAIPNL
jgi:hypothetical protein